MTADLPMSLPEVEALSKFKCYLVDEQRRIDLHQLVHNEAGRVMECLSIEHFPTTTPPLPKELTLKSVGERITEYEELLPTLHAFFVYGCFFGCEHQNRLWASILLRIGTISGEGLVSFTMLNALRLYPALLLFYSGGIAAIAEERYHTLAVLLNAPITTPQESQTASLALIPSSILDHEQGMHVFESKSHYALQEHLFSVIREPMRACIRDDTEYQRCFDLFEYFLGLTHMDLYTKQGHSPWGPVGLFAQRFGRYSSALGHLSPQKQIAKQVAANGDEWQPLKAGLFEGKLKRFQEVQAAYDQFIKRS